MLAAADIPGCPCAVTQRVGGAFKVVGNFESKPPAACLISI
jgi:hypothetical protein